MAYTLAGKKSDKEDKSLIQGGDGHMYIVVGGYHLPHYVPEGTESMERLKLDHDLTRRFFSDIESSLRIQLSDGDIATLMQRYSSIPADDGERKYEKNAMGATLVGAIASRLEKLSDQKIGLISSPKKHSRRVKEIDGLMGGYISFLLVEQHTIMDNVRRRNGMVDIDGVLREMIGEIINSSSMDIERVYDNRRSKIAGAMEAIDTLGKKMIEVIPAAQAGLKRVTQEYVDAAKVRSCVRRSDPEYPDADIKFRAKREELNDKFREVREKESVRSNRTGADLYDRLNKAGLVINDMAEIRLARKKSVEVQIRKMETTHSRTTDYLSM